MSEERPTKRRKKMQNGEKEGEAGQDTKRALKREQQAADPTSMPQVEHPWNFV